MATPPEKGQASIEVTPEMIEAGARLAGMAPVRLRSRESLPSEFTRRWSM